jgi:thymidylate kinase
MHNAMNYPAPPTRQFRPSDISNLERDYLIVAFEGIDGSGKSTAAAAVEQALNLTHRAFRTRLSAQMGKVFRNMVDSQSGERERYQDVIPAGFRAFTYAVDAAVQFRYLEELYNSHDVVIFDRWLPTYHIYCSASTAGTPAVAGQLAGGPGDDTWWRNLIASIPSPDLIFYLKADPRTAAYRLAQRGDWTARNWTDAELLADLTRLDDLYAEAMEIWPGYVVDGNLPLPQVVDTVLAHIARVLPEKAGRPKEKI